MGKPMYGYDAFRVWLVFKDMFHPSTLKTQLPSLSSFIISISQNEETITVSFSSVLNAESYRLYINGSPVETSTGNSFVYTFEKNGDYNIQVRAFAAGYKFSRSDMQTVTIDSVGTFLSTLGKFITANLKKILVKR